MHKIVFLGNLPLPHVTSYGFLASCQNLEKTNDTIPRKCLDRGKDRPKDGQKDKQTLFHRTLPANNGGGGGRSNKNIPRHQGVARYFFENRKSEKNNTWKKFFFQMK